MNNEKIQIDYDHNLSYSNTAQNVVGASTSSLRTIPTNNDANTKYVKKYGTTYAATAITDATLAASLTAAGQTLVFYFGEAKYVDQQLTEFPYGALYGSVTDNAGVVGAYANIRSFLATDGVAILIKHTVGAGDIAIAGGTNLTLDTDVDAGGLTVELPNLYLGLGEYVWLVVSSSGSTYYTENFHSCAQRHTETGTQKYPYFTIASAYAALGGAFTQVGILDSEVYVAELTHNTANSAVIACAGCAPTMKAVIGQDTGYTFEPFTFDTNIFFNENGNDANDGTWQRPTKTISAALALTTGYVTYGGLGASGNVIYIEDFNTLGYFFNVENDFKIAVSGIITVDADAGAFYGWKFFDGSFVVTNKDTTFQYCDFDNVSFTYTTTALTTSQFDNCFFRDFTYVGADPTGVNDFNLTVRKCILTGVGSNFQIDCNCNLVITNNICYDATNYVFRSLTTDAANYTIHGTFENNTFYNCKSAVYVDDGQVTWGAHIDFCIMQGCTGTFAINNTLGAAATDSSYSVYYNNVGDSDNVNQISKITTNPVLSSTSLKRFGLSASSSAYKANGAEIDCGAKLGIIQYGASGVIINGLILDCNHKYNNGYYYNGTGDYSNMDIKWCTIKKANGIGIDLYCGVGAGSGVDLYNSIIDDCAIGSKVYHTTSNFIESIFMNCLSYGLWITNTGCVINHCVFYLNQYGLYVDPKASIKNTIFNNNSLYGCYSGVSNILYYCCISDSYNASVTIDTLTTITDDPLFVNTVLGSENFNIKTIEAGYTIDSPCKDAGELTTFPDIGAYDISRSLSADDWKVHQLTLNPKNIEESFFCKDVVAFSSALGNYDKWAKDVKRNFVFNYESMQYMNETDRKKFWYFLSNIKTRQNQKLDSKTFVRLHFLPVQKEDTGTTVTIDQTNLTVTDSTAAWIENEHKGFWLSLFADADASLGSVIAYCGAEVDLSEVTSQNNNGVLTRTTAGLDGTVGKYTATIAIGGAGNYSRGAKESLVALTKNQIQSSYYVNCTGLTMANTDLFEVFLNYNAALANNFENEIYQSGANRQIRLTMHNDSSAAVSGAYVTLTGTHYITSIITRANTATSSDGTGKLYIDGVYQYTITGIDNYNLFEGVYHLYFGLANSVDIGTTGSLQFDEVYFIQGDVLKVDKTHKVATLASSAWIDDEWIGKYLYLTIGTTAKYFLITDNDSNQLTLADPFGYLVSGSYTDWAITAEFKIAENTETVLTIKDPDSILPDFGTTAEGYHIDYMKARVKSDSISYRQPRYYRQQETWKTGFQIEFEED